MAVEIPRLSSRQREPEPVEAILDDLHALLGRYLVLGEDERVVVSTWIVHTHALPAAYQTPYLHISSPLKRSGKTRTLELLRLLAAHAVHAENMSLASIHKLLAREPIPTILLDEIDTVWRGRGTNNQALRGVVNAGNRRGASVIRVEGNEVVEYPVFGPKVLAGIGQTVPDTIADRSIPIRMQRKTRDELVERFRYLEAAGAAARLYHRCREWADARVPVLRDMQPELPEGLTDRQQDFAEPLLAIADDAGARWSGLVRQSLLTLLDADRMFAADDEPEPLIVLRDCRDAWATLDERNGGNRVDRARSQQLYQLVNMQPRWNASSHFNSERDLAWFLNAWDIRPKKMRIDGAAYQGYLRSDFELVWERYL